MLLDRLLRSVFTVASPDPLQLPQPCWCWVGSRWTPNGYARAWDGAKERAVHRILYELLIGPIPSRLVLDHLCRRRSCVNPWHCEPVTVKVNTHRGNAVLFTLKHKASTSHG